MPASNVGGYTKRVTATAFVFLAYCIGNIVGPHAFLASEAPIYQTGIKMILACSCCQFGLALFLRYWLTKRNAERDRKLAEQGGNAEVDDEPMRDLTDFEVSEMMLFCLFPVLTENFRTRRSATRCEGVENVLFSV